MNKTYILFCTYDDSYIPLCVSSSKALLELLVTSSDNYDKLAADYIKCSVGKVDQGSIIKNHPLYELINKHKYFDYNWHDYADAVECDCPLFDLSIELVLVYGGKDD